MPISKKIRITIVLSAIWSTLVLIYSIDMTEKGRYFHFDDFFRVLIIGALLPLLVVWGIIWIRSASKSEEKEKKKTELANKSGGDDSQ